MKANPVGWFEIYVQDLPRAKKFYETVFATELQPLNSPFPGVEFLAFPMAQDSYGVAGALVKMEGGPSGGNTTLVYFACEDCAVEEGRVAGAGGKVEKTKMSIGEYGPVRLRVEDSLPQIQDKRIELTKTATGEAAYEEHLAKWDLELQPGAKEHLKYGYTIKYPADLQVELGR